MKTLIIATLGAWLMGSLAIAFVATQNFRAVERVLRAASGQPELARYIERLGAAEARTLLRHLASEMNRFYFQVWGWSQLFLALVVLVGLWGGGIHDRIAQGLVLVMIAIVLVAVLYLTPEVMAIGRRLDFVPRDPPPPDFARFRRLHAAYTLLDLVKLGMGAIVLFRLARLP
ncbi:MAG: hypothetical protein N2443_00770 [Blastocatellia bacterium]|nr:hypothetical protein [Blastocatellia bacterium]MCX7751379.1 hypothetical protein [Blastocatellia bacterium]MDW8255796.1 hypothetical protein [Acidobacteriota bacterium]